MNKKILVPTICLLVFVGVLSVANAVDADPPEAVLKYNPEIQDIEVTGIDNMDNNVDVLCLKSPVRRIRVLTHIGNAVPDFITGQYRKKCTLTDDYGNTLEIYLKYQIFEGSVGVSTDILSMRYNMGSMIYPVKNSLVVKDYNNQQFLYQRLFLDSEEPMAQTTYSQLLDKTKITEADSPWDTQTLGGMSLIQLMTNSGNVDYNIV